MTISLTYTWYYILKNGLFFLYDQSNSRAITNSQCPGHISVAYRHTNIARAITIDERSLLIFDPIYVFREEASPLCNRYSLVRKPQFYLWTAEQVRNHAERNTRD